MAHRRKKILVVEDNRLVCDLLRLHLAEAGYEVEQAPDAIDAGYSILRSPPDLLIVDLNMPYMSGHDLVATLLADTSVPSFPFIFLSGDDRRMDQAAPLGASACLLKPIGKPQLLAAVARALDTGGEVREQRYGASNSTLAPTMHEAIV